MKFDIRDGVPKFKPIEIKIVAETEKEFMAIFHRFNLAQSGISELYKMDTGLGPNPAILNEGLIRDFSMALDAIRIDRGFSKDNCYNG